MDSSGSSGTGESRESRGRTEVRQEKSIRGAPKRKREREKGSKREEERESEAGDVETLFGRVSGKELNPIGPMGPGRSGADNRLSITIYSPILPQKTRS